MRLDSWHYRNCFGKMRVLIGEKLENQKTTHKAERLEGINVGIFTDALCFFLPYENDLRPIINCYLH